MQMTVMSEGLLLKSKYIKMGREEGGFQALLTQLSLVIVYHELIIWRLTIYLFYVIINFYKNYFTHTAISCNCLP